MPLCRELGERKEKKPFLSALKLLARDALFYATDQEKYAARHTPAVREIAEEYGAGALLRSVELIGEAEKQIQFNANFGMALFTLSAELRKEKERWQRLS